MKAVLDSCVALKWVLVEADSPKAVTLRTQYQQQQHELLSPDVFHVECAHALVRAERKAILRPGDAAALLGDILSTPPVLFASPLRRPCGARELRARDVGSENGRQSPEAVSVHRFVIELAVADCS
jgi:hypothetical protein